MVPFSPIKNRRKAVKAKSLFASPETKRVQRNARALIINEAAKDLMRQMGDSSRLPYGSMDRLLKRYRGSCSGISRSQVQKQMDKIKNSMLTPGDGVPSRIHVTTNSSVASTLTAPSASSTAPSAPSTHTAPSAPRAAHHTR